MTSGAVKLFFPLNSSLTFLWWAHYNCGASVLHCLKFQAWVEMKYFLNLNIYFLELVKYFHVIDAQSVIGFIASLLHSLTEPAHSDAVGAGLGTSYSWSLHLPICQAQVKSKTVDYLIWNNDIWKKLFFLFNSKSFCCPDILSDKVKFNWFVILWLSVLQLSNEFIDHDKKVSVFGLYWDHELDPHVCHELRVLNLFQSFYKGDINPLIVAAMAEQQISEPPLPGPPTYQCSRAAYAELPYIYNFHILRYKMSYREKELYKKTLLQ